MVLSDVALLLAFALWGASLKLADFFGEIGCWLGYVSAAGSAACLGLLLVDSPVSSAIVLGIAVGVVLAGKVDRGNLVFGLLLGLGVAAVLGFLFGGFVFPSVSVLAVVAAGALLDELGHDRFGALEGWGAVFRFRSVLKVAVLVLFGLGLVNLANAVGFFCFDLLYDAVGAALTYEWKR